MFSLAFVCFIPQFGFPHQSRRRFLRIFNSSFLSWLCNPLMNRVHCFSPIYRRLNCLQGFAFSPRGNKTATNIFMGVSLGACRGSPLWSVTKMELLAHGEGLFSVWTLTRYSRNALQGSWPDGSECTFSFSRPLPSA